MSSFITNTFDAILMSMLKTTVIVIVKVEEIDFYF